MKTTTSTLRCIYISYKKSDLSVRSIFSFTDEEITSIYHSLKEIFNVEESFIISTCNRTEIYYYHHENISSKLIKYLCTCKGVYSSKTFTSISNHEDSIKRLFEVGTGLNSQILGDQQIINQFKKAYQTACDNNAAGVFFHKTLHTLFHTNKRIVNETKFSTGQASIAYITTQLINSFQIHNPKILIIGIGDFGKEVAKNTFNINKAHITLSNRSIEKALTLAKEVKGTVLDFDKIQQELTHFDIIINCAHTSDLINEETLKKTQKLTYTYFIDLSVTCAINKNIESVTGNIYYNLDDLKDISDKSLRDRKKEIPKVQLIINEELTLLKNWHQSISFNPVLNMVKNTLEEIRKKAIGSQLKTMNKDHLKVVNEVTLKFMNEVIKIPAMDLQQRCLRGEDTDERLKLISEIFTASEKNLPKIKS